MSDTIVPLNSAQPMTKTVAELRRCSRCVMPETQEAITFDDEGVCSVCRQVEYKQTQIDWDKRKIELFELIDQYRGKYEYDCIVPFSGGKDSTYTLYALVAWFHLKPLVVRYDHGFLRPTVLENTESVIKQLGVDYLHYRPNWQVIRKVMLEALKRKGDFCWHCHTGVFAFPMHMAIKFKTPLIFWGEPSAEYNSYYNYDEVEEVDERRFNRFVNLGITAEDMVGMLDGTVSLRDLKYLCYPDIQDLRAIRYRSVCLGSYIPWDVKKQVEIIKTELGWRGDAVEGVPGEYDYEKIECAMQGTKDYIKFLKRGYARTAHLTSIDIRNGRMTREEALRMTMQHDGKKPKSLEVFLNYVGITEKEFMDIVMQHVISPFHPEPESMLPDEKLWDQDRWDQSRPLNANECGGKGCVSCSMAAGR